MRRVKGRTWALGVLAVRCAVGVVCPAAEEAPLKRMLDSPLLFVKRHNYGGIHIYDTFYKWGPGGGIYVLENPSAPADEHKIRAVIDATTPGTLGHGVYCDPDLSWDAARVLFCFKPELKGSTSIYEIGIDGKGLRRLTDAAACGLSAANSFGKHHDFRTHHDVGPAYLPDGRIVFTSTRQGGLVPCFNNGVAVLHVMNADGSDIRVISINPVNEFDPCPLPDGRILYGRWEYLDKGALTQQSLWTIFPDGSGETAFFANNMVFPEAILDARPVPGSPYLVMGSFTPHNAPPRGTIARMDPRLGKNDPRAILNFDQPQKPTHDRGDSCEPWPLSGDVVVYSGKSGDGARNAIMMMDAAGRRERIYADPEIDCHSPMPVKPRVPPAIVPPSVKPGESTGYFFMQDVYQGLNGVERGEVKWLRVIEETSRTSATHPDRGPFNQRFIMSAALAWSAKVFLGIVPVEPDGSAYFEVPSGGAMYLQALDGDGRLVQSMRTYIQAAAGVTRSCIGCHEDKHTAPVSERRIAAGRGPSRLAPESWGSGFLDYPGMVQPIFDKHCVSCHGGEQGFAGGLDLSGGWTRYFNCSYENLVSRRNTQVTAHLIAGIDCMNGTSLWGARIFPPRGHGSGAAPLAEVLMNGHEKRIPRLSRAERDLIMAWIDTNGLYHGTWNYTGHGHGMKAWDEIVDRVRNRMQVAGCVRCHERMENDWINLRRPEFSRMLRAPLAKGTKGWGLGLCRDRQVHPAERRLHLLVRGYSHGVEPLDFFQTPKAPQQEQGAEPVVTFASVTDTNYVALLEVIRRGRELALAAPRVDMPGAEIIAGAWRKSSAAAP